MSLPILPITRKLDATIELPGSKSITNRALLLAALCDEPVTLQNALFSDDTRLMSAALRQLGLDITENESTKTITLSRQAAAKAWDRHSCLSDGEAAKVPQVSKPADGAAANSAPIRLQVGLAGTAARFLTALCAAAPRGAYEIDGTEKMRTRPEESVSRWRYNKYAKRCKPTEVFPLPAGPKTNTESDSLRMALFCSL